MSSDVEMEGRRSSLTPDLHLSPPATTSAATSRRSSLAVILNDDNTNTISVHNPGSAQAPISIPVLVHSPSPAPSTSSNVNMAPPSQSHHGHSGASSSTAAAPPPSAAPATQKPSSSSSKPVSSAKPRSTKPAKPARSPSPSPPPPAPPVPLQTIRLDIRLGGPLNYEVDISRQAKDTGQRPPTPPPVVKKVHDSSESEEEEDDKKDDKSKLKKRKKKNAAQEYYDTSDPFIDDSELALDERQYFAQTKQQGFYVSSGEVALLKDKTPKKPKSKKISFASGLPPMMGTDKKTMDGVKETPIQVDESSDNKRSVKSAGSGDVGAASAAGGSGESEQANAGQKRKRHNSIITEGGKRKKVVDEKMFHPDLQAAIREMRELVNKESWEHKGKFPPALKPHLAQLAILAIKLDEYDDDFFSLMPALFPYNKFTMTKLIKRTVFTDHLTLLTQRQDILLAQLAELATAGFPKAEEEWEKNVLAWDKRQEKTRAENAEGSAGTAGTPSAGPTRQPTEEMDVDHPHSADGDAGGKEGKEGKDKDKDKDKDHGQHPPGKRYRMTEQMKSIVWELVLLSNECCRLENEKNSLEGSIIQISDQGLRKVLYQKIVAAFPEGWMSSGQISRDVSVIKKKLEKEAMEQDADD